MTDAASSLTPLLRRLDRLPEDIRKKAIRSAISRAATVVVKQARLEAPKGSNEPVRDDGTPRPRLKKTLTKRIKRYGNSFVAVIGSPYRSAPHDHLVHDGTRPHVIHGAASVRGRFVRRKGRFIFVPAVIHPGSQADPYLQRALNKSRGQAMSVLARSVRQNLERLGE